MNTVLDVHYAGQVATSACLEFRAWSDDRATRVTIASIDIPSAYRPGRFFERELPCLLNVIEKAGARYEYILIDGYVYLKPPLTDGLGSRLASALGYGPVVIGVAKNPLAVADRFVEIRRGRSSKPLFVSAVNASLETAAELVAGMHGAFRIPTLIGLADQTCRTARET